MQNKIRNSKGQFVKNEFKGLQYNENEQPVKPVNVVLIVAIMAAIFGVLVLLDKCKVIELVSNGGF